MASSIKVGPFSRLEVVTPHDSNAQGNLAIQPTDAIWVGGAGNMSVDTKGGATVLISGIAAGTLLPFAVTRIRSTSTTATLIVGVWS